MEVLLLASRRGDIEFHTLLDGSLFTCREIVVGEQHPCAPLPPHDVIFNVIADADVCGAELEQADLIAARSAAPVVNPPSHVGRTTRVAQAAALRGIPGVVAPAMRVLAKGGASASSLDDLRSHGFSFPFLLRSAGHHQGEHFELVSDEASFAAAFRALPGPSLIAIEYLDAYGADGAARKYRCMFIGGTIYPLHLAISSHWKIHYFSADMESSAAYRAEEAAFLDDMEGTLGSGGGAALTRVMEALRLDYAGIDFARRADGTLLVFEANAAMAMIPPPPSPMWRYRLAALDAAYDAVRLLLLRKAGERHAALGCA